MAVDGTHAAGGHEGHFGKEGLYLAGIEVEYIGTVALDVGRLSGDGNSQMVLGDDFDGEMFLKDGDVGVLSDGLDEAVLDFGTGVVLVMEDAELGVTAFAVQVEFAFFVFIEVYTPFDELLDL